MSMSADVTGIMIQNEQRSKTFLVKVTANKCVLGLGAKVIVQYTDEYDEMGLLIKEIKKL